MVIEEVARDYCEKNIGQLGVGYISEVSKQVAAIAADFEGRLFSIEFNGNKPEDERHVLTENG